MSVKGGLECAVIHINATEQSEFMLPGIEF